VKLEPLVRQVNTPRTKRGPISTRTGKEVQGLKSIHDRPKVSEEDRELRSRFWTTVGNIYILAGKHPGKERG
jgi:hypothetical protein